MFRRVLLAVDGTASGDVAVDFAGAMARDLASTVRVVHVNERIVGGRGFTYESEAEAKEIVDRAVAALRGVGVEADGVNSLGDCFTVGERIADAAGQWGADVIVFGSKRRRWWSRLRGTGLRERVTALTGLPVLTAPAPLKVASRVHGNSLDRELAEVVGTSARD